MADMDRSLVYAYKQNILEDLQRLIAIPSVQAPPAPGAPYGAESVRALDFVLSRAHALGFTTENIDGHAGHVEYGTRGPLIGILVHLDVVPAGDGWTHDPFGGTFEDGCVYGRGASDNKGPAIAALYSLRALADELGPESELPARFRIIYGLNEESGMAGVTHYFSREPLPDYGFSPDAAYPLLNREKGIAHVFLRRPRGAGAGVRSLRGGLAFNMVPDAAEAAISPEHDAVLRAYVKDEYEASTVTPRVQIRSSPGRAEGTDTPLLVTAAGVSAHGGSPAEGVNAAGHLLHFLSQADQERPDSTGSPLLDPALRWLADTVALDTRGERLGIACADEESGELSVNLGMVSVTATEIEVGLDIRYPVTCSWERIHAALSRRARRAGFAVVKKQHLEPLFVPSEAPLVKALLSAYSAVTGESAEPQSMAGGTYARMLKNRGVAFGANFPGEDTRGHRPDEFIRLDSLMKHAEIQTRALHELSQLS
jgi:succinyl-diaminopimelate desuccinylase